MPNRLASSTSPYLLQHADNPVDWWEWGEEAFAEARRRDVPVFVSIGYSACHWCHVMAHESFEDPQVAELLNRTFVSIKVDREERPDVDSVYMEATVALTGHGGWPMSVFVDHEGRAFYAGTYFPPAPRHGLPSFAQIIGALDEAWRERRDDIAAAGTRILDALEARTRAAFPVGSPDAALLAAAIDTLEADYDRVSGGFGGAPKFPPSMLLEFLLREAARTGDQRPLRMAEGTLDAMARGGMFDQIGGGFARYSVDSQWVVPHFEKMLYDNALLLRVYAHWFRLTGSALAERVVRMTAEFMLRELRTAEGAFASALDADSEGVEGKFYAWSPDELRAVLGDDDGRWAAELLGVTDHGTFEHGFSTLQLRAEPGDPQRWGRVRAALMDARDQRARPHRDDKVVAAWNGLAIAALADAGAIFDEPSWIDAAIDAADYLIAVHLGAQDDDRLVRTSRGARASTNVGVLDDYADTAEGFQALYQVTGDDAWLVFAGMVLDVVIQHFGDGDGGFFDTADDAPALVRRPWDPADNAEPSGWLATAHACVTQAALTGEPEYRRVAEAALGVVGSFATRAPRGVGWGLAAASALLAGPLEIALVGDVDSPDMRALLSTARRATSPGAVVAFGEGPLLHDRPALEGRATAYVCRGFVCDRPTSDPNALAEQVIAGH